jgi:hypothetical protein
LALLVKLSPFCRRSPRRDVFTKNLPECETIAYLLIASRLIYERDNTNDRKAALNDLAHIRNVFLGFEKNSRFLSRLQRFAACRCAVWRNGSNGRARFK